MHTHRDDLVTEATHERRMAELMDDHEEEPAGPERGRELEAGEGESAERRAPMKAHRSAAHPP